MIAWQNNRTREASVITKMKNGPLGPQLLDGPFKAFGYQGLTALKLTPAIGLLTMLWLRPATISVLLIFMSIPRLKA